MAYVWRSSVDRAAIARLVQPSGMVDRWLRDIALEIMLDAKAAAPMRSGRLRDSIGSDRRGSTATRVTFRVYASVPYAAYVERGTTGPITANLARSPGGQFTGGRGWLPVGKSQGHISTYAKSVRGQAAQRFLQRSMEEVLSYHRIL